MILKREMVYIAGPMRGIKYYNFPAFDSARDRLRSLGYDVCSPADLDRQDGYDALQDTERIEWNSCPPELGSLDEVLRRDLRCLLDCDQIYMLPGWQDSKGACAERAVALWAGKGINPMGAPYQGPSSTSDAFVPNPAPAGPCGEVRVVDPVTGGAKGSKLARFDLIPTGPLWELAEHYGKGARKYEERNYERGYKWSLSFAAAMRHLQQFWGGEDMDGETGCKHVIAAAWHCFALALFMKTHPELDDRPKGK